MADIKPGVTRQFCSWVEGLTLRDVPGEMQTRAKYLILDGLGCAIVAAHLPWTEKATNIVLGMEAEGSCPVWGYDKVRSLALVVGHWCQEVADSSQTIGPLPAALLNSTQIQGFEIDDWHSLAPVHSNAIVLPALFAAAANAKAKGTVTSGESLLLSTIVGYEAGPRVGLCLYGSHMLSRGWHSGVVFGHAQAAAAVAKLLNLSADRIEDAVGIACTQSCGLMSAQFSSDAKRMQHGFAARNGLFAALLAAGGYSGIKNVFEEPYGGFLTAFSQGSGKEPPFLEQELVKGLGETWQLENIRVKPYAAMAGTHSSIDAMAALQKEYPDKLKQLSEIKKITFEMSESAYKHGGWTAQRPLTATGAQMSCAYAAAVQLIDGQVLAEQFQDGLLDRDERWELIDKIECRQTEELGNVMSQRAIIEFKDGSKISKYVAAAKGVDPPLSNQEIVQKFRTFTKALISEERQRKIEETVLGLESVEDISELQDLLTGLTSSPFKGA
jgi:aconitate decarboxylase